MKQTAARKQSNAEKSNLTRADWLAAAKKILISEGVEKISLRKLSDVLGVTTGAFYWLYKGLGELQDDLLLDWKRQNNAPFERLFGGEITDWKKTYLQYVRTIILKGAYDPTYDNAVRTWARTSAKAREQLKEVDTLRINQLIKFFHALGFDEKRATVRAHSMYYHQSSYFQLDEMETEEERLANAPYYAEFLTGHSLFPEPDDTTTTRQILLDA